MSKLVPKAPKPVQSLKATEVIPSPKAEKLYRRIWSNPRKRRIKRYFYQIAREQGVSPNPANWRKYLRKVKRVKFRYGTGAYPKKRFTLQELEYIRDANRLKNYGGDLSSKYLRGSDAEALRNQLTKGNHLKSIVLAEGDDTYAGNEIPDVEHHYRLYGKLVVLRTYPDWDNYQEDFTIYLDDVRIAVCEN